MGQRGPPPKSRALKKAQGTYRKYRDQGETLNTTVPPGSPPMPADLDEDARRLWLQIVPELLKYKTLSVVDGGALEAYCRSYTRWSKLEEIARAQPITTTPFGPKVNPASAESRKLRKDVLQPLELALGLHYAARARVKMPPQEVDDPAALELFGGLKALPGGKAAEAPIGLPSKPPEDRSDK
jgi:P27 family predicted phage terminase small subunit